MRPGRRMHSLSLTSPGLNLWSSFLPFGHTVLQFPGCQRPCEHILSRYRVRSDRQGQGNTNTTGTMDRFGKRGREREREHKQNHSCAQHARCAKMPDLLLRKNARLRQRNKPDLTGVRQSSGSRQNQAGPTWHVPSLLRTLSTSIPLPRSHTYCCLPELFPLCVFIYLFIWSIISHC